MTIGLAPVLMPTPTVDDFSTDPNGLANATIWMNLTGDAAFIPAPSGADYSGTEMELPGGVLPSVENGALQLTLQTFENNNPNVTPANYAFQGSQIVSKEPFDSDTTGQGYAFTAIAKFNTPIPAGIDGGIFTYGLAPTVSSPTNHNELDFEAYSAVADAQNNQVQTNVYVNQPTNSTGSPFQVIPAPSLTSYETYTIEWFPNEVLWFINGALVQHTTTQVPQASMQFYLNIWASNANSTALQPTAIPSQNQPYTFEVQMASVAVIQDINTTVTISGTASGQPVPDTATLSPFKNVVVSDVNPGAIDTVTVTLSNPASGTLSGSGSYNSTSGVYTVSGSAAAVTGALDGLVFNPALDQDPEGQTVTTSFAIDVTDTASASANDSTTSVTATETSPTYDEVQSAYQAILRTTPTSASVSPNALEIDSGQTTLARFETGLIVGEQAVYTTLPALVTIDAFYNATPGSPLLTTTAAATSGTSYYTAAELHNLGYSDANVWTVMASGWGADPTSEFYGQYDVDATGSTAGYTTFINAIYTHEFGSAPTAANLQNLVADVPGVQSLLTGGGHTATPIQVMSGLYGYLLYVGQTTPALTSHYAASANAFLQAAANGAVIYGPELTQEFPPGTSAATGTMTGSSSQAVVTDTATISGGALDAGDMTFLGGSTGSPWVVMAVPDEAFVARNGTNARINGFSVTQGDTLDLRALLNGVSPNLSNIGNYVSLAPPTADGSGGWITDLTVKGPGGTAMVALDSSTNISSVSQLYAALALPTHYTIRRND